MNFKTNRFEDKVCLITGGGSGIGSTLATSLSESGASVYVAGRNLENLERISSLAPNIVPLQLDVTDTKSWSAAKTLILNEHKRLDLAVFNAGTCEYVDLPEFDAESFRRVMEVNFMGIINGLEACFPLLRKSEAPHIAAVTSSVAALPLPRAEAYGASKAAATYMLSSLRLGLIESGIDVSVILPGFVETPMTDKNDFDMPFIISAEKAASHIMKGLAKRRKEIYFPGAFTWPLRFISILPVGLRHMIARRFVR